MLRDKAFFFREKAESMLPWEQPVLRPYIYWSTLKWLDTTGYHSQAVLMLKKDPGHCEVHFLLLSCMLKGSFIDVQINAN